MIDLEKVRKATAKLEKSHCQILQPGKYLLMDREVKREHDRVRHYDYLYVRLECDGQMPSDRFPITDDMIWKLGDFLSAVGLDVDSLSDIKDLVGRTGQLSAELQPDGKTVY
jgi:hypothetical protein